MNGESDATKAAAEETMEEAPGKEATTDGTSVKGDGTNSLAQSTNTASVSTNYFDLLKAVVTDEKLTGEQKSALITKLKGTNPTSDRLTYRTAIYLLGFLAVISIIAIWSLAFHDSSKVPDGLIAIASSAVGGLAGLLSPSRNSNSHEL